MSQVFLKGQYWTPKDDLNGQYKPCPIADEDKEDTKVSKDCQSATTDAARGSELIMKSAEKMRLITQHVERSQKEQAHGARQMTGAVENISSMVNQLHKAQRQQTKASDETSQMLERIRDLTRTQEKHLGALAMAAERLHSLARRTEG